MLAAARSSHGPSQLQHAMCGFSLCNPWLESVVSTDASWRADLSPGDVGLTHKFLYTSLMLLIVVDAT